MSYSPIMYGLDVHIVSYILEMGLKFSLFSCLFQLSESVI